MSEAGAYEELLRALTVERFTTAAHRLREAAEDGADSGRQGAEGVASAGRRPPEAGSGTGKLLLRVEEAAELLDVGRTRIYDLIRSGGLPSVKIGGSRRIPTAALQRYIDDLLNDRA